MEVLVLNSALVAIDNGVHPRPCQRAKKLRKVAKNVMLSRICPKSAPTATFAVKSRS